MSKSHLWQCHSGRDPKDRVHLLPSFLSQVHIYVYHVVSADLQVKNLSRSVSRDKIHSSVISSVTIVPRSISISALGFRSMARTSKCKQRAQEASDKEEKIQQACAALREGTYTKMTKAAEAFDVSYPTLRRRYEGTTQPRNRAHEKQMLLSSVQEKVLCDWLAYLGSTGHPISKRSIPPKVQEICGTWPSKFWIRRFLARNPTIVLRRSSGLDPKRARAFNKPTSDHHFKLLKEYIETHDIPWENVYNMDEKGIQLGGGRKGTREKYFYSRDQKAKIKIQSGALELVTVIEVVCADGTSHIKPGFVFSGVHMSEEWFCEDGVM